MGAATLADSLQAMHVTQSAHFDDHRDGMGSHAFRETVSTYLAALLALGTALLVSHVLGPWGGAVLPFVTVFGAVAAAACVGGYRPAALVSILGYVLSAWLLVPDQAVPAEGIELRGWLGLVAYLLTCTLVVGLVEIARRGHTADRDATPHGAWRCATSGKPW